MRIACMHGSLCKKIGFHAEHMRVDSTVCDEALRSLMQLQEQLLATNELTDSQISLHSPDRLHTTAVSF